MKEKELKEEFGITRFVALLRLGTSNSFYHTWVVAICKDD
jgi:hypothetical protein